MNNQLNVLEQLSILSIGLWRVESTRWEICHGENAPEGSSSNLA